MAKLEPITVNILEGGLPEFVSTHLPKTENYIKAMEKVIDDKDTSPEALSDYHKSKREFYDYVNEEE